MTLLILALALFVPPLLLFWRAPSFTWPMRYLLAVIPAACTGIGWQLGFWGYTYTNCQGGAKNLHDCLAGGVDITAWVGYGLLLMIPFLFLGVPLSLWFLLDTAAKHLGQSRSPY
ncbi:hypothetical protein N5J43_18285 [Pseudomonas nicosulfuronedens]|uniref:Uncharacterized protein n=1 Tax=Pseudomonas nicosulfuronedens TaxID=2571105 RepID=A0A5R9QMP3_9PSED|nr:hypothetical protein [Pseudomonas nicosulfuronedens]MDH1009608.1 hypothetical protein [Pseudomonas nicosulfuronedens]MDH1980907.1 hypothetical protein [Pseudomonas nicosulfuronedens]MDH2030630.1 hypothetical protein [Pseudomonas nicosulfuronedens]TLX70156.1 hypothetical protein FAS41_28925 [Pseudomonas nicosulfuronedens]